MPAKAVPCSGFQEQSRQDLSTAREGKSTTSQGSLCQCSPTLTGKKFILMFLWNFLSSDLYALPLVLSLDTAEKSLELTPAHLILVRGKYQVVVRGNIVVLVNVICRLAVVKLNMSADLSSLEHTTEKLFPIIFF